MSGQPDLIERLRQFAEAWPRDSKGGAMLRDAVDEVERLRGQCAIEFRAGFAAGWVAAVGPPDEECHDCSRVGPHTHCPECGGDHTAANCEIMG